MWWHTVTPGRGSEGETGEWSGCPVPFTLPRNMVYPALIPLIRTPRLPVVDWTDAPRWFKWTPPFRRKTKSGFCACAIRFKLAPTDCTVPAVLEHSASKKVVLKCTNARKRVTVLDNYTAVLACVKTWQKLSFRNIQTLRGLLHMFYQLYLLRLFPLSKHKKTHNVSKIGFP